MESIPGTMHWGNFPGDIRPRRIFSCWVSVRKRSRRGGRGISAHPLPPFHPRQRLILPSHAGKRSRGAAMTLLAK
ncbi:hypothetical protein CXU01_05665 [Akkermansia muciniphila]|nr:hypothetical protein CXU01_05665 [Akkermansia muciniphila]